MMFRRKNACLPYNDKIILELINTAMKKPISRTLFNTYKTKGLSIVSDKNVIMIKIFGDTQNANPICLLTQDLFKEVDIKTMEDNFFDPTHQTISLFWFLNPQVIKDSYYELKKHSTILHISQDVNDMVFETEETASYLPRAI